MVELAAIRKLVHIAEGECWAGDGAGIAEGGDQALDEGSFTPAQVARQLDRLPARQQPGEAPGDCLGSLGV